MTPMLDPTHTHTPQEQTLWDHMQAGEWDEIETLRPDPADQGATDQFAEDHANAHAHYQDAHEAPENQREAATRGKSHAENEHAGGPHNMQLFGLDPAEKPKTGSLTVRAIGTHYNPSADVFIGGVKVAKKDVTYVSTTEVKFVVAATQAPGTYPVYVNVGPVDSQPLPFTVKST